VEDLRRQVRGLRLQLSRQQPTGDGASAAAVEEDLAPASDGDGEAVLPPEDSGGFVGGGAGATGASPRQREAPGGADGRVGALEAEVASLRKALVVERDRADAFEAVLRQHEAAAAAQQVHQAPAAPGQATQAAGEAGGDAAGASPAGTPVAALAAAAKGGSPASVPATVAVAQAAASPTVPATAAAPTPPASSARPAAAGRPSAALLAASPLLAASREVAEWVADAAATAAATPPGQRLPLLRLLPGAEEVCCERESHMGSQELAALKVTAVQLAARPASLSSPQRLLPACKSPQEPRLLATVPLPVHQSVLRRRLGCPPCSATSCHLLHCPLQDKVVRLLAGAEGGDDRTQALAFAEVGRGDGGWG
jgi:hypothetical protein